MFTICWTASSWPTTRLSRVFSRHSASWPVLVGSRTFRNRLISASPSFLFFRQIPVTPQQCEIELLNLSEFTHSEGASRVPNLTTPNASFFRALVTPFDYHPRGDLGVFL